MCKPKVGFYWCASCGGCEEAVVDLADTILDVVESVDIVFWPVALDFKRSDVEAMRDSEMAVCFVNGAIRTSEQQELAELLRRKSQLLVAFGSCAHLGGVPGLANFFDREDILETVYDRSPSTVNPDGVRPQSFVETKEGKLTLPTFADDVRTLDQMVTVDYYLPGCPPPVKLIMNALSAILENKLPEKGSVLAPNIALCDECPRKDTKPDDFMVKEFKRPHEVLIEPEKCLLDQGLLCLGPITRSGCEAACVKGNMPCSGCLGPTGGARDYGAKALSATASVLDANEDNKIIQGFRGITDPAGTFYRYSLPSSFLHGATRHDKNGGSE
ncbi:MAG: oxidoreductase [Candidatus Zixiibacteriota bacterium]